MHRGIVSLARFVCIRLQELVTADIFVGNQAFSAGFRYYSQWLLAGQRSGRSKRIALLKLVCTVIFFAATSITGTSPQPGTSALVSTGMSPIGASLSRLNLNPWEAPVCSDEAFWRQSNRQYNSNRSHVRKSPNPHSGTPHGYCFVRVLLTWNSNVERVDMHAPSAGLGS